VETRQPAIGQTQLIKAFTGSGLFMEARPGLIGSHSPMKKPDADGRRPAIFFLMGLMAGVQCVVVWC
jgi:hypothetical protein